MHFPLTFRTLFGTESVLPSLPGLSRVGADSLELEETSCDQQGDCTMMFRG
jgi:hypothetical protein